MGILAYICIYSAGQSSIEYVSSFPKQPYSSKSVENWQAQPASKLTNFPGHFLGRLKDSRHFVSPKKKVVLQNVDIESYFSEEKKFFEKGSFVREIFDFLVFHINGFSDRKSDFPISKKKNWLGKF